MRSSGYGCTFACSLLLGAGASPPPVAWPRITLRGARPNSSLSGLKAALTLPDAAAARLELYLLRLTRGDESVAARAVVIR